MINDVLPFIDMYRERNGALGMATVVKTYGSAPRQVGAKMIVSASGTVAGSVSGGCIEGSVFETLQEVMKTGVPQLLHFGIANEEAWEVGLACGGEIDVFCERLDW